MIACLVLFSALAVSMICTVLVLHRDYEDGFFGRVGLAFIALACSALAMQLVVKALTRWLEDIDRPVGVNPALALLMIGLASFFGRHLRRFLLFNDKAERRATMPFAAPGKR